MQRLRQLVESGDYDGGIQEFCRLSSPSPADCRWVGICYHQQGIYLNAELQFQRAIQQGDVVAHIYLAALQVSKGHTFQAKVILEQVCPQQLPDDEAAFWFRERARIGWMLGEPRAQLFQWSAQAWERCSDQDCSVQVSVANFIGSLHQHYDMHEQALAYLDFAAEQGHLRRLEFVALCRSEALIGLNRFEEAEAALAQITTPSLENLKQLNKVHLLINQEKFKEARDMVNNLLPHVVGNDGEEFRARVLGLSLSILDAEVSQAWRHLIRAKQLANAPLRKAKLKHRMGLFLSQQKEADGLELLQKALKIYSEADLISSAVSVQLALAEVDKHHRTEWIKAAATAAASLGRLPNLSGEWPFLPEVKQFLQALPTQSMERLLLFGDTPPPDIKIQTLGTARVFMAGQPITFRHKRTIEILCYFCRHQTATFTEVRNALFPDALEADMRPKNYFHQVRVDVAQRLPGLVIAYDEAQKNYRLAGRLPVQWDVNELEKSLKIDALCILDWVSIEFLPDRDTEWIREERTYLSKWVTQVGIETMETWFQSGDYDKCIRLAERLLPIDPLDEALHTYLLTATYHLKGRLAALHRYYESASTFMEQVDEVPRSLRELEQSWRNVN